MLFAVLCTDRPDSLEIRAAAREDHLRYVASFGNGVVEAGPMLDAEGLPSGSLLIVDLADRAAAEAFAANDPYAAAGLFGAVVVSGYRAVFRNGVRAG